jgi:hypothetical protein
MIRKSMSFVAAALMLAGGAAFAGSESEPKSGTSHTHAEAAAAAEAQAAASAAAELQRLRGDIDKKSAKVSTQARAKAEADLDAQSKSVEKTAEAHGSDKVAARLAGELGVTAQALMDQKTALEASWGELMIAHALAANASADVTVEQLVALKRGGMGWGTIAAGLDLNLGSVVSSVKAEGRVANGLARADGRVAAMSGPGARVGASAGVRGGLGLGQGKAGAGVGAGGGLKIGK